MRCLLLLVLGAGLAAAAPDAGKPTCTGSLRGSFWPDDANHDRAAARRYARDGSLEICTSGLWRFKWERLGVNYQDLLRRHAPAHAATRKDTGQTLLSPGPAPSGSPE